MPRKIEEKEYKSFPDSFLVVSDTNPHEGKFTALTVVETPSFPNNETAVILDGKGTNLSSLSGKLMQGFTLYGNFTKIALTAGSVIAYL